MMTLDDARFDTETRRRIQLWLDGSYDSGTKQEIERLAKEDPDELADSFYTHLSFGTGGLRGVMGVGTNRMNQYTVRAATQGVASYVKSSVQVSLHKVFISYDSRHKSRHFAEEAARVLAANQIEVYLTQELRPTPLVSFGCRHYGCHAAIMITASHNPPSYNGYKVYWGDGGQVVPPHDRGIIDQVSAVTDSSQVSVVDLPHPLIKEVGSELDQAYLEAIADLQTQPRTNAEHGATLGVAFSNLHGTGSTLVPATLASWGFTNFAEVKAQARPDGHFPTVVSPNPEERTALELGIELLLRDQRDILLATDPDADRVGVAVLHEERAELLTGNQIACLCLSHICERLYERGEFPIKVAFVKTIATTELFRRICDSYQRPCFDTLTGFKYIAQLIRQWEEEGSWQYLFGGEESYGYLLGTKVRDKDAVVSCALLCEVALHAKLAGKTLIDLLHDIYRRYGIYREKLVSLRFPESREGHEKMKAAMTRLRNDPPGYLNRQPVATIEDYLSGERRLLNKKETEALKLPKSDVVVLWLADGSKVMVRPSGTEPKVKLYCGVVEPPSDNLTKAIPACDERATAILDELNELLNS